MRKSFQERRELLRSNFNLVENEFGFAKSVDGKTTEEIQEALEESIKGECLLLANVSLVYDDWSWCWCGVGLYILVLWFITE